MIRYCLTYWTRLRPYSLAHGHLDYKTLWLLTRSKTKSTQQRHGRWEWDHMRNKHKLRDKHKTRAHTSHVTSLKHYKMMRVYVDKLKETPMCEPDEQ